MTEITQAREAVLKFAMDNPSTTLRLIEKAMAHWDEEQLEVFGKGLARLEKKLREVRE